MELTTISKKAELIQRWCEFLKVLQKWIKANKDTLLYVYHQGSQPDYEHYTNAVNRQEKIANFIENRIVKLIKEMNENV